MAKFIEPLLPLVPDSPTAKLLFDVWSGQRLVRGRGLVAPEDECEAAAVIASQMHRRAGANVMVFDDSGNDRVLDGVRRFVPESSIWYGEHGGDIDFTDISVVFFASEEAHVRTFYFFFDLVIFVSDGDPNQMIGPAYMAGYQLLTFAEREDVPLVDDALGRDMPPDVAFAGGIDR